jgi:putative DNA-invertase from lambdoid prophage Rac
LVGLQPGDIVLVPKLDRMFRSAMDALSVVTDLRERQIALHMLDLGGDLSSNGISKLVFTILSAVAEAERDRIRERVTEVKRDQRARNRHLGGTIPFGFRKVPTPPKGRCTGARPRRAGCHQANGRYAALGCFAPGYRRG